MGEKLTLISTFHEIKPILPAAMRMRPNKIILLISPDTNKPNEPKKAKGGKAKDDEKSITDKVVEVKGIFAPFKIEVEGVETAEFDVYLVAKKAVELIDSEFSEGRKIVADITGARKPMSVGLLFACYARREKVSSVVYSIEGSDDYVELPMLSFRVSPDRQKLLNEIEKGEKSMVEIAKMMGRSRAFLYQQLVHMKKEGYVKYIDGKFEITTAGRIARL